jgi:flagellar biosynthetic protein FliR
MTLFSLVSNLEGLFYFLFVLARVSGMMLIAPIFSNMTISQSTKSIFTFFVALIFAMTFYKDYFGENPKYVIAELDLNGKGFGLILMTLTLGKELIVGFLIGFVFGFLFEALLIAGQLISLMIGLSVSEILDPISGTTQTIISQLLMLMTSLLILTLDLHHLFLRMLGESFHLVPIGTYHMPYELLDDLAKGSGKIFSYGMRFSAIPYIVLFLVTFALGFMAKVMPEMNIFMVGFPLKIFIGYYALIASIAYLPSTLDDAFREYINLVGLVLKHLGTVP